jgi:hypothetical protein
MTITVSPNHQCTGTQRKMEGEGIKEEMEDAKKTE